MLTISRPCPRKPTSASASAGTLYPPQFHCDSIQGACEYLEETLARIDAPRLDDLHITFFNQIIYDTPQLVQFISRRPTLSEPEKGLIALGL